MSRPELDAYIEHFRARVLQDALSEATRSYWLRRAGDFEKVGNASCDEVARNCRRHADLVPFQDDVDLITSALEEVA